MRTPIIMRPLNRTLFGSTLVLLSNLLVAGAGHEHDHSDDHSESLGAHVHGEAELMLAYEGGQLQMMLHSPAGNIVGFEHRVSSSEEQAALDVARSVLNTPEKLFVFDAPCILVEQNINVSALESLGPIHDDHKKEQDHHHEDEHSHASEHEHKEGRDHESEHNHDHASEHAEILAEYTFECSEPVSGIRVELLNSFPAIERLNVRWVTESGQGASELSQSNLNVVLD